MKPESSDPLPKVVIVGGGFAGLQAARSLGRAPVHLTVIDQHNWTNQKQNRATRAPLRAARFAN